MMNMLTGVMVDVIGTTAQLEQEEKSLATLKRDIADVVTLTDENHDRTVTAEEFANMPLSKASKALATWWRCRMN